MIIYAIYIISKNGSPLLSETFQSEISLPDSILLAGLMTALQGVASELTESNGDEHSEKNQLKNIEIEGISYHIRSFDLYKVVLVTDNNFESDNVIHKIGLQFMQKFGRRLVNDEILPLGFYNSFKPQIHSIINKTSKAFGVDETKSINPSKKLTTYEIFNLPKECKQTAFAMLELEEATVITISQNTKESIDLTKSNLEFLKNQGYIGVKYVNKNEIFFCSIN